MALLLHDVPAPQASEAIRPSAVRSRAITAADRFFTAQLIELTLRRWIECDVGRWNAAAMTRHIGARCAEGRWRVLMVDGTRIGFFALEESSRELRLEQLFIHPDWQGQGIGLRLVEQCQARGRRRCKPIRLSVLHSNPARRFYQRCGFVEESRTRTARKLVWFPS
ncbi:MAG: GNAT family N-acetyltransferase [Pseudomonadota bacterium]